MCEPTVENAFPHTKTYEPSTAMIRRSVWAVRLIREKLKKSRKSHRRVRSLKSPYCRDVLAARILTKLGIGADPDDVVTYANFDVNQFRVWTLAGS